jgi:hypothetical protein
VYVVALAAVLAIGLLLRGLLLRLPMRYDEAYTFYEFVMPGADFARSNFTFPNNQILNSVLMHASWQTFGNTLWSLRLPALVGGALIPVFAFLAARRLYDRRAGLWAAALTATAGPIVEFSVNARGYALGGMFVVASLWLAARLLDGRRTWEIAAFAACAALAVYSVPTMGYGLLAIGLWAGGTALLRVRSDARPAIQLAIATALAGLLAYLLYLPTIGDPAWGTAGLPPTWESRRVSLELAWTFWMRTTPFPLPTLLAFAFAAAFVVDRRRYRHAVPLAGAIVVTTIAVLFVGEIPPFARSWFALLPLCAVALSGTLAAATELLARRIGRPSLLAVALPVIVAVAMSADLLISGQHESEEFPTSDNHIVNVVRDQLKLEEVLVNPASFDVGIRWYFDRFGYTGGRSDVTPAMRRAGQAVVIVPGHDGRAAVGVVAARGGRPAPRAPFLMRDLEYVSIWRVALEPEAAP